MIVDSSALIAIVLDEPEASDFTSLITDTDRVSISAATFVEAGVVVDAAGDPTLTGLFDDFLAAAGVVVEPVTPRQALVARQAYRDFGRGSGHPAQLNFGDCFAYALAKERGEPLLFKGNDFAHTDVMPASPSGHH